MVIKQLDFKNLEQAWSGINEYFFKKEDLIVKKYGTIAGPSLIIYNMMVTIEKPYISPKFDFGAMFGYSKTKWNSLVSNYLDKNYLDLIKNEVYIRQRKGTRAYNLTLHFTNNHVSGKDCLISCIISKKYNEEKPTLIFHTRASEVTKRLLFDLLLVQRIAEFIYGKKPQVHIELWFPYSYITPENFVMYDNYRSITDMAPKYPSKFQSRVLKTLDKFKYHPDPHSITFKVNKRSAMQLQRDKDGNPLSGVKGLLVRDLVLPFPEILYPLECVTETERRNYRKTLQIEK